MKVGKLIKIGLYTRESTREQAQNGYNLKGQDRNCRTYLENKYKNQPYTIELYEEAGCSSKTLKRPELKRLINDIVNYKINVVCVYDILRLIRRIEHWFQLKPLFEKYNVTIVSATSEIDLASVTGEIFFCIQLLFGQLEQDTIGKRTSDGLKEGAEQGYFIKGGKPSFGFKRNYVLAPTTSNPKKKRPKLEVIDEEKEVLHKMRNYLLSGYAPYAISLLLKNEPYLKSINRTFNENQVTRMLTDKLYSGIMEFQNKDYILDSEKIFTIEQIEEHKKIISKRQKTSKYEYLFNSKVFTTKGDKASRKSTVKENGAILYYFDLNTKNRINEKKILDAVLDYFQSTGTLYTKKRNRQYTNDVKRLRDRITNLHTMYENNRIMFCEYSREVKKLEEKLKQLKKENRQYTEYVHTYFNNLSSKQKRLLIDKNINRIEVDFITKEVIRVS